MGDLRNCIIYENGNGGNDNYYLSASDYCCTTPLPENGTGNFTNEPLFLDQAGGDLRLQTNSPCINTGNNGYAAGNPDFDGRVRIVGGIVDMGAFEFQGPGMGEFLGWLQQNGLPTNGSVDYVDADGDLLSNWQEWIAGTDPTNSLSVLRLMNPVSGAMGVIVSWQSVTSRNYFLERGTELEVQQPFLLLKSNIFGQPGTTTFTDTNAVGDGPFFYRVGVQE